MRVLTLFDVFVIDFCVAQVYIYEKARMIADDGIVLFHRER